MSLYKLTGLSPTLYYENGLNISYLCTVLNDFFEEKCSYHGLCSTDPDNQIPRL